MLRALVKSVGEKYGQDIIVENRPGANTIVGATACKNSTPDGHTLCLLSMSSMMLNPLQHEKLSYDPEADFAPVTKIAYVDHVIIMNKSVPFNTLKELVEYSKANPDKLNYASNGVGGDAHLLIEWIKAKTGAQITHVPFQGMAPAIMALEGGHVHMLSLTPGGGLPDRVARGELKALLVDSNKRLAILPNTPDIEQAGLPPFLARTWLALFAPKNTPPAIISTLNKEFASIIKDKDFQDKYLLSSGYDPVAGSPEELADYMRNTRAAAMEIVKYAQADTATKK
jgi:tripartite-type tricarboxylate transporter receptor subunit TctC